MARMLVPAVSRGAIAVACVMAACASSPSGQTGGSAPSAIALEIVSVPLNSDNPAQRAVGRFSYAGGLELKGTGAVRFGGLSDLEVLDGNRVLAVTDEGDLLEARLVLDTGGRLTGLADLRAAPLTGLDGKPLPDKAGADAEGLAVFRNGDRLVSFERQHRIWRYPAGGAAPVAAPAPPGAATLPFNSGFEALVTFPAGGDASTYLVGSEGGDVWLCDLQAACRETPLGTRVPDGYGLTALAVSPDSTLVALLSRAYDGVRGVRAVLRLLPRAAIDSADAPVVDELTFVAPLTRDNFEGVAIVPSPTGVGLRIYLLSDNNYSTTQHTYLLAFDWRR